jgi:diaminopropionate ammonia-lyase
MLPGYTPTPLVELPDVAARLGVGRVLVKDESDRLGLPAFKMLGASWAGARVVRGRLGGGDSLDPDVLRRRLAESGARVLLCTATAGNHGRAVARTARLLGVPARIWVPAATPGHLSSAIEEEGADVVRVDGDYDDAVAAAHAASEAHGDAVLVQDTASGADDGEVPGWVVEGYATLLHEVRAQLGQEPDILVVPVGVGSLALATATYGGAPLLTVEPAEAACLLTSLAHGEPRTVRTGRTAMAGLNAGTVSAAAWPVLRERVAAAVAVADDAALIAAEELHAAGVAAGACGGAALAGLERALADPEAREALGAGAGSCIAVLSTDGAHRPD